MAKKTRGTRRKRRVAPAVKSLIVRVKRAKSRKSNRKWVDEHGHFKKGHPGFKPKGARSLVPRGVKASMRAIMEEIAADKRLSIRRAFLDGITSGPGYAHHYLKMMAEHLDGRPDANINMKTQWKEDELQQAERILDRKMNSLLRTVMAHEEDNDTDTEMPASSSAEDAPIPSDTRMG